MIETEGAKEYRTGIAMEKIRDDLKRETLPQFEIQGRYYEGIYYTCSHCGTKSVGAPGVDIWICNNCGVKNIEAGRIE